MSYPISINYNNWKSLAYMIFFFLLSLAQYPSNFFGSLINFELYIWQKRCPTGLGGAENAPSRARILCYVRLAKIRLSLSMLGWIIKCGHNDYNFSKVPLNFTSAQCWPVGLVLRKQFSSHEVLFSPDHWRSSASCRWCWTRRRRSSCTRR